VQRAIVIALLGTSILVACDWVSPLRVLTQPVALHSSNPSAELFDETIIVEYKEASLQTSNPIERRIKMENLAKSISAQLGVTAIRTLPSSGIQQFRLQPGQSFHAAILALRNHPQVLHAGYNYRIQSLLQPSPPNDPEWTNGGLWNLIQIKMNDAWEYMHDATSITVAVVDSGIDYEHSDIKPNMWKDGATGVYGRDTCGSGSWDPMDTIGHGTMVAGIIGAKGDNSVGVVGVNWSTKLLAARFLCGINPKLGVPVGNLGDAIEAIDYAIEKHADIVVTSWRVTPHVAREDIPALENQVRKSNCQGPMALPSPCKPVLFVAAAGNGLSPEPLNSDLESGRVYPANFPVDNILPVAASDYQDNIWYNSHYGMNSVPIAAPGVDIDSTTLRTQQNGIEGGDGTSMAAPHVAGCAALLQARCLKCTGSLLSVPALKARILESADTGSKLMTGSNLPGFIKDGRRLNCGEALKRAPSLPNCGGPAAPTNLTVR